MRTILMFLIIISFAGTSSGQTTGTWIMNPDKSKHSDDQALPRRLIVRFEPHAQGEVVTLWRTTQEGQSETDSFIQYYDGRDHPYPREERSDFVSATKLQDGAIAVILKKDGKVVFRQARRLMPDGDQMLIEEQVLSKSGQWQLRILVFERQKD